MLLSRGSPAGQDSRTTAVPETLASMRLFPKWPLLVAGLHATLLPLAFPRAARADDTPEAPRSPRDRFEHPDTRLPSDPTRPPVLVHIRSPGPVNLQRETGDRREPFAVICTSPCDTLVPAGGRYRISGYLVRSSRPFTFPADVTEDTLDVRPASSTGFMGGILLVSLGVIAVQVGFLWLFADTFADLPYGGETPSRAPAVGVAIGGLVVAVTGGVLWALNGRTGVSQTSGPSVEVLPTHALESAPSAALANSGVASFAPSPATSATPVFMVPLVAGTF